MASVALGVMASAAIGDDHSAVVSVDPEARRGTAGRHDGKHGDLKLHCMVSHSHGEVTVSGHNHTLPLLLLDTHKHMLEMYSDIIRMSTQKIAIDLLEVNAPHLCFQSKNFSRM